MADLAGGRLYREVVVWRSSDGDAAVRYTCFEDLTSGLFCVQVADFVRLPFEDETWAIQARNRQELFLEGQLEACDWYGSLQAAIAAHDRAFS